MTTTYDIKCAKCNVSINGPADAEPQTLVSCPVCGISDTRENVEREVADYVASKASDALTANLERIARNSKFMTFTSGSPDHRSYRFIVDYRPEF